MQRESLHSRFHTFAHGTRLLTGRTCPTPFASSSYLAYVIEDQLVGEARTGLHLRPGVAAAAARLQFVPVDTRPGGEMAAVRTGPHQPAPQAWAARMWMSG